VFIHAQMQYKMGFFLNTFEQFLAIDLEIAGSRRCLPGVFLFRMGGWKPCLFYCAVNVARAISDALAIGFDPVGTDDMRTIGVDRLSRLLRPRVSFCNCLTTNARWPASVALCKNKWC